MRSVQKIYSLLIWKNRNIYEEDTKYKKHCTWNNDASVPFKVGTLGSHTILPITISCSVVLSWISLIVWNLFPFGGDFSFGKKTEVTGRQIWAVEGLSPLGNLWKLCTRRDAWGGAFLWWSCQSPVIHSWGLLNHLNSFHGGMFKLNANMMHIRCTTRSIIWMWWPHSTHAHSTESTTSTV